MVRPEDTDQTTAMGSPRVGRQHLGRTIVNGFYQGCGLARPVGMPADRALVAQLQAEGMEHQAPIAGQIEHGTAFCGVVVAADAVLIEDRLPSACSSKR